MAIHEFTCPGCKCIQRVKAQAGEEVKVELCDACANDAIDEALGSQEEDWNEGVPSSKARRAAFKEGKR